MMRLSFEGARQQLVIVLASLVLVGYPFVGTLVEVTGLPHQMLTYPYRGMLLSLSFITIAISLRAPSKAAGPVLLFLALYSSRLLFDWLVMGHPHASTATTYFMVTVVIPTVAIILGLQLSFEENRYSSVILVIGAPVVVAAVALIAMKPEVTASGRASYFALNSISLAEVAAVVCLTALVAAMRSMSMMRIITLELIAATAMVVILYANSRGPILALAVALLYLFATNWKRGVYFLPILAMVLIWLALNHGGTAVVENGEVGIVGRMSQAVEGADPSVNIRFDVIRDGIEAFFRNPLFGSYFTNPSKEIGLYPHNILVETAMSMGVVGLLSLAYLAFHTLRASARISKSHPLIVTLLIQATALSMVSGSIWGAAGLFPIVALAICLASLQARENGSAVSPRSVLRTT
jgi:O-antigen ligase